MIIDRWFENRQIALAAVTTIIVIGALWAAGPGVEAALRYDRAAIEHGEWWRLLSGHFVHAGGVHTLLNVAGVLLVALLFPEPIGIWRWWGRMVVLSLMISALIYYQVPNLGWYVGLSGTLHGYFVLGFWWLYRSGDRFSLLLLVILLAKLTWEHFNGPVTSNEDMIGVPVLTEAHSFGAISAVVLLWLGALQRRIARVFHPSTSKVDS